MLNRTILALFAALLLTPALTLAQEPVQTAAELDRRLQSLEETQAELYHTLEEKKSAEAGILLDGRLILSGLIEVEGSFQRTSLRSGGSDEQSDLALATTQLGLAAKATENLGGTLTLLYEEADDARTEVDEATIDLAQGPWQARVGRQYLPFGVYRSHFISDPLTLELGEIRETALRGGFHGNHFALEAFLFNGGLEKAGENDQLRDFGASLSLTPIEGLELGASYLSDLTDNNAQPLGPSYSRRVGGWSAQTVVALGPVELSGEYLGAIKAFAAADLDVDANGSGDRPRAWNLEAAWHPVEVVELAARFEGSEQFAGQPNRQYGLACSWGFRKHASLALEYLRGHFDQDFGSGARDRDLVGLQLALAF